MSKKAVVLLSGGLDSATVLAIAQSQGFDVHAMSFRYGQRHEHELQCAERIAAKAGVAKHVVAQIDLRAFEAMANLGTKAGVEGDRFTVRTPLIAMTQIGRAHV